MNVPATRCLALNVIASRNITTASRNPRNIAPCSWRTATRSPLNTCHRTDIASLKPTSSRAQHVFTLPKAALLFVIGRLPVRRVPTSIDDDLQIRWSPVRLPKYRLAHAIHTIEPQKFRPPRTPSRPGCRPSSRRRCPSERQNCDALLREAAHMRRWCSAPYARCASFEGTCTVTMAHQASDPASTWGSPRSARRRTPPARRNDGLDRDLWGRCRSKRWVSDARERLGQQHSRLMAWIRTDP